LSKQLTPKRFLCRFWESRGLRHRKFECLAHNATLSQDAAPSQIRWLIAP
jgi:hypothetical protein